MKRHLFTAASAIALVLCVAAIVLWVRGERLPSRYWRQTFQSRGSVYGQDAFDNMRGVVAVAHFRGTVTDPSMIAVCQRAMREGNWKWSTLKWMAIPQPTNFWERQGFYFQVSRQTILSSQDPKATTYYIGVPHWILVLLSAVLPVAWALSAVRRFRHVWAGVCPACGYDLRASPDRCPECGTPVRRTCPPAIREGGFSARWWRRPARLARP